MATCYTLARLKAMVTDIDQDEYDYDMLGVRVIAPDYDEYGIVAVGMQLPCSHAWDDGEYTDEELRGTSCISLRDLQELKHDDLGGYYGARVILIGGYNAEGGNDCHEIIIRDAVCLAILE